MTMQRPAIPIQVVLDANIEQIKKKQPFVVEKGQTVFYAIGTYEWIEDMPADAPREKQKQYAGTRFIWLPAYDAQGELVPGMHRIYGVKVPQG